MRGAELIASLCLATGVGMGFPFVYGLHTPLVAIRLGDRLGSRRLDGVADLLRVPALPRGVYGLLYPRVAPFVRVGVFASNLVLRRPVRGSVHSDGASEAVLRDSGLSAQSSIGRGTVQQLAVVSLPDAQQAGS